VKICVLERCYSGKYRLFLGLLMTFPDVRKLIRSTAIAALLACLASCGGDQQQAPTRHSAGLRSLGAAANYEALVQQLYLGYFGRPADPAGLAFYANAMRTTNAPSTIQGLIDAYAGNADVRELLDGFANSAESQQLYPACDWIGCDYQWVYALYRGLFSRDPDDAGGEYWANALNSKGATRAQVLLAVVAGAQGRDADLLVRKVGAAVQFSRTLDAGGNSGAYNGQLATAIVRAMMQNVPGFADDAAVQSNIAATIQQLSGLASGTADEVAPPARKILLLASAERLADNGSRLTTLATVLARDLNQKRPNGPAWTVTVAKAADTVLAIRAQLKGYDGAILVGRVPYSTNLGGTPMLDVYRLPDCPAFQFSSDGDVANSLAQRSADPLCQYGVLLSVLRGTTAQAEPGEIAAKLDQMIAYHRASDAANAAWTPSFRFIEAGWFGGPDNQWGDLSELWSFISLYARDAVSYLNQGSSTERRDAFLSCIGRNIEMCGAIVHGSSQVLSFEGPGVAGRFYSDELTNWTGAELATQSVKAKYIEMVSCSTQNFLTDQSIGSALLMRGSALLTHGSTTVTGYTNYYQQDAIQNEYVLLQNGNTFAEAFFGRMEGTPLSIQGDPYITVRPLRTGAQPKLVLDGKHYRAGVQTVPYWLADAVGGASVTRVVTFSNQGNADLHLRIGSIFASPGVDYGTAQGGEIEYGYNAQYETNLTQVFSDGRALSWPDIVVEQMGGAMPVTLEPGQSVAITYKLSVRTGADGKPKRPGLYTGQLAVTSDDPDNARLYLMMKGRVLN
jgi:hypothetical protein